MKGNILIIIAVILALVIAAFFCHILQLAKPLDKNTDAKLTEVDIDLAEALHYASLAANSHNAQNWRLELRTADQEIKVFMDDSRTLPATDPTRREAYISLGCYLESLAFALDTFGYDAKISYTAAQDSNTEIAAVSYQKRQNAAINEKQLTTIKHRHTDKTAYKADLINPADIQQLLDKYPQISCFETGSTQFEYIQKESLTAMAEQNQNSAYREELNHWLRFSNQEAEQKQDGMPAEQLGLRGLMKGFYYLTTNHGNAEGYSFAKQSLKIAANQLEHCSAFFVITGGSNFNDWLDTGRATQAFWYDCVEKGISLHPISALPEVRPADNIKVNLGLSANAQMILRAGYTENYGENTAYRRNLKEYITVIN